MNVCRSIAWRIWAPILGHGYRARACSGDSPPISIFRKQVLLMRSSITISYLRDNVPIRPSHEICVIDAHPPGLSLDDILKTATNVVEALEGDFSGVLTQVEEEIEAALKGKNAVYNASDHLEFLRAGSYLINGQRVHPDEIGVVFRATSEDKITKSFGRADQPARFGAANRRPQRKPRGSPIHARILDSSREDRSG